MLAKIDVIILGRFNRSQDGVRERVGAGGANRFAGGLGVALNGADETSFVERKRRAGGARQGFARLDEHSSSRRDLLAGSEGVAGRRAACGVARRL